MTSPAQNLQRQHIMSAVPVLRGIKYATWDPTVTGPTYSNGNLTATCSQGGGVANSTIGKKSGKWYFEISIPDAFSSAGILISNPSTYAYAGSTGVQWRGAFSTTTYKNGAGIDTTLQSFEGTVMGIALDMDGLQMYFYRNGVLATGTVNPVTGLTAGGLYKACCSRSGPGVGNNSYTANFGATALSFAPPSGYNAGLFDIV